MRYIGLLITLFVVGCAQLSTPESMAEADWSEFGKQRGVEGQLFHSQERLAKYDTQGVLTDELYMAYENGYGEGKAEYCSQSAHMLGVMGKPYRGVCDDINIWFRQDYDSGRQSGSSL
ncbi:DUF2799 domain-containing protein [Vibrio sp. ZSDE26]|uniref:DUF2799 domain-containing protein n=1 Tax=Vibrio amylolyticus TaxID=2847292 RepID=A0A9X2BHK8_9VIBR|nr:DUF2799 domain-containing protein [Vibrio amylolyticus]MCK6263090.1 DUF2799 domain-containing protein [Vibrio amylolyticus]